MGQRVVTNKSLEQDKSCRVNLELFGFRGECRDPSFYLTEMQVP